MGHGVAQRRDAALDIMEKMKQHSPTLVEQSLLVSKELIRVAILWHEMWHEVSIYIYIYIYMCVCV